MNEDIISCGWDRRIMSFITVQVLQLTCVTLHLSIVITPAAATSSGETTTRQYCHNEVFRAECPSGRAILATSAVYGRMALGRCVKTDFGFVGCYVDVLGHVHRRCSGRRVCNVRVPDSTLDLAKPCNEDLKSYMEVIYTCVRVAPPEDSSCQLRPDPDAPTVRGDPPSTLVGYIGNRLVGGGTEAQQQQQQPVAAPSPCGSESAPWQVTVGPGQRIRFTLMDFSSVNSQEDSDDFTILEQRDGSVAATCRRLYATVRDLATNRTAEICGGRDVTVQMTSLGDQAVTSDAYVSEGSRASVVVHHYHQQPQPQIHVFLIRCDAVGCEDLTVAPSGDGGQNVWMQRLGDKMLVGCMTSSVTWQLFCVDGRWEGPWRNCSLPGVDWENTSSGLHVLSNGMAVVIIVIVTLAIALVVTSLVVTSLGVYCMQRSWRETTLRCWDADLQTAKSADVTYIERSRRDVTDRRERKYATTGNYSAMKLRQRQDSERPTLTQDFLLYQDSSTISDRPVTSGHVTNEGAYSTSHALRTQQQQQQFCACNSVPYVEEIQMNVRVPTVAPACAAGTRHHLQQCCCLATAAENQLNVAKTNCSSNPQRTDYGTVLPVWTEERLTQ